MNSVFREYKVEPALWAFLRIALSIDIELLYTCTEIAQRISARLKFANINSNHGARGYNSILPLRSYLMDNVWTFISLAKWYIYLLFSCFYTRISELLFNYLSFSFQYNVCSESLQIFHEYYLLGILSVSNSSEIFMGSSISIETQALVGHEHRTTGMDTFYSERKKERYLILQAYNFMKKLSPQNICRITPGYGTVGIEYFLILS